VGGEQRILVSELSGKGAVLRRARDIGLQLEGDKADVEATIKIHVGGERIISTAEGNGPVSALDTALRQAIAQKHPHLSDIELVNYKVRILDEDKGTGAVTRVLLDASDGDDTWGSIGVSENIIEASWEALVDSIEYGMVRSQQK
jgi:2-isopropylmalate synthase